MNTIRNFVNKSLEVITVLLLSFMVVLGVWQIITRYVFNNPSVLTEELLLVSFVWMGLLGMAYVFGKQEHMRMGFFADRLNPKAQHILRILTEIAVLIFAALVLVWGGMNIVFLGMGQISPALGISMGYIYLALPIGGLLTVFYTIANIIDIVKGKESK